MHFSFSQFDYLTDCTTSMTIGPVKKKTKTVKRLAPWSKLSTSKLNHKTHKYERNWYSAKLEESSWHSSLVFSDDRRKSAVKEFHLQFYSHMTEYGCEIGLFTRGCGL